MIHKRSRSKDEWCNKGYKYWAKPTQKLPQHAYDQAKLMMDMWNRLVAYNDEVLEQRNAFCREKQPSIIESESILDGLDASINKAREELKSIKIKTRGDKEETNSFYKTVIEPLISEKKKARDLVKDERKKICSEYKFKPDDHAFINNLSKTYNNEYGLYSYYVDAVVRSFKESRDKFIRGTGGKPRKKDRFTLSFSMRNKNKGFKFEDKLSKKTKNTPFWLDPPDERGRTNFYWKFGEEVVTFRTIIHRPLPEGSFIKAVTVSKDNKTKRWSLVFSVEMPKVILPHGDSEFYFTPKWSIDREEGDIWIGNLFEVSSPEKEPYPVKLYSSMDLTFNKDKTHKSILSQIKAIEAFRSVADRVVGDMKKEIQPLLVKLRSFGWDGNLEACGIKGVYGIQKVINTNIPCHPINGILLEGIEQYRHCMHNSTGIDRRVRKYRDWCYWNLAKKIAERAKEVKLEKIDFEKLGRVNTVAGSTQDVESSIRKFKNYVAPRDLYDKIKKKCAEHGVKVTEIICTEDK